MENNFLRKKVKHTLQVTLDALTTLEQAGYLSPQVWGGLLILGIVGLVIWAQYTTDFQTGLPGSQPVTRTPHPFSAALDYEPVTGPELSTATRAIPLQSAPTATAFLWLELTPLPTPTPPFVLHTVQEAESLISIAAQYGVTTESILAANDIRDPTALQRGQQLLIPPAEGLPVPVVLHQIRAQDDLLSIATLYGSSLKDIVGANPGIDPDRLPVDQTLVIPIVFNQPKPVSRPEESQEALYYKVQTGDIPLVIATQFNVPVEVLLASNGITDATRLRAGQELYIPPYEGESFSFPVVLHELVENDSLLNIAIRYGSSVKDILAVNPELTPSALEPGQVVAVPIVFSQPKPTPAPGEVAPPVPVEASEPLVELQQQMLAAINEQRADNGLPFYEFDDQLAATAVRHAQDMVERQYLAHVTPEGLTVRDRVRADGVTASQVGENIQVNTKGKKQTVGAAIDWFMSSPPHRQGILDRRYNRVGIGIVSGPPGRHTFVIVFAKR